MKHCPSCKNDLPLEKFGTNSSRADGKQGICKECRNAQHRIWYSKNAELQGKRVLQANENRKKELRDKLYEYLSTHPCVDCGESDPVVLEFDHFDPTMKSFGIAFMLTRRFAWSKMVAEIEKCDVRCANCHKRRTSEQFGWWKSKDKRDSL